ncbi:MAG: hypothetical protein WD341_08825 [Tistlia sp.]|uniref:hypothetical protein n=1 Tax=Tistlia sp. TaxID=3057121 RepID=UPI0034A3DC41
MTTTPQVRAAILAKLQARSELGLVHGFERYSKQASTLVELYTSAGAGAKRELRGWYLRRLRRRVRADGSMYVKVETEWRLRGFLGLEDAEATETVLDSLVDAIEADFRADDTLGGLVERLGPEGEESAWGWQLTDSGPVMFGSMLCNSAELSLTTVHSEPRGVEGDPFTLAVAGWNLDAEPGDETEDHVQLEGA